MSDKLTAKSLRDLASAPDSVAWGGSARQMLLWAADLIDAAEGIRAEVASLKEECDKLKSVWSDHAALHANLLHIGYPRELALHLAGATDYDALTQQLAAANGRVEMLRKALVSLRTEFSTRAGGAVVFTQEKRKAIIDAALSNLNEDSAG
jgi:hypothetical protein